MGSLILGAAAGSWIARQIEIPTWLGGTLGAVAGLVLRLATSREFVHWWSASM